jgi:outer membrane protein TolC
VGLVFELPLSGTRRGAQRRAAEVSAEAARERLDGAEQRAKSEAASELVVLAQAQRKVDLAFAMAEVAARNAQAQQRRYDAGDAIALEVHEAEDALRRAKLALQRSLIDARQASIRLDHLTGELLRRHAAMVPDSASKLRARSAFGLSVGRF